MVRPVRSPERQLGLLWGGVAAGIVILSPLAPHLAEGFPACPLKAWSGWPCLGCGTTRAAMALARLDLQGAMAVNPLAASGWLGLIAGGILAGGLALVGHPLKEPRWILRPTERLLLVALVLANWIYLIWAGT